MDEADRTYMRAALDEAFRAYDIGEVPIGAVVVRRGEIIGRGHNRRETWKDPTAHAEILAIQEACRRLGGWRLTEATLYVTIEPCSMCAGAIVLARIPRLVYGAQDPKAGAVDSVVDLVRREELNHRVDVTSGVLEEECRAVIQRFFRELRNRD
ncbi:MAG: tRNA adenosine(34) deaminase TadA [Firmicutes bacterium]|jgi:tRNA(adenine34) deaminase|nr:tRNA adenosine(34) deaminase TadA [Bacillota bacterium]